MKTCCIFGAGEYYGEFPEVEQGDFIIAADGGYSYLRSAKIEPALIIGDFDSLPSPPAAGNVVALERVKDDTDMLAAVKAGLDLGFTHFRIYGGAGGRIDHTLANIQSLAYLAERGCRGFLYARETIITILRDGKITFPPLAKGFVSVFAYGDEARGVSISGLKYPLNNVILSNTCPIGVSNEFIGKAGEITVQSGMLLITYPI